MFLGHADGTFSAYDARTLQEVWSFNVGTGINAPAITYAVNGKAICRDPGRLAAKRQHPPVAPELKNTSTASMLFVFAL